MAIAGRKAVPQVVFGLGLVVLMAPTVFFFFWMISLSLKTDAENLAYPPVLIPRALTLANW
jgi:multiple sugar transport system permease protein